MNTTPDLRKVRRARYGANHRLYVGGDLIGTLTRVEIGQGPRGGTRIAWQSAPALLAWQGRPIPDGAADARFLEPTRGAATHALADHLRDHGAAAVAPLYGHAGE